MNRPDFPDAIRRGIFLTGNLYENSENDKNVDFSGKEICDTFAHIPGIFNDLRLERIVSSGSVSPAEFWYDQAEHEWVVLLTGGAVLEFSDTTQTLAPGDWVFIPAHLRHRVAQTDASPPTRWLALFFRTPKPEHSDIQR